MAKPAEPPETAGGSLRPVPLVLLDVDVVLDVLGRRQPFYSDSAAVLAACEAGLCRGLIAAHTVTTLFYLLAKRVSARIAHAHLQDLLQIVDVATVDGEVIRRALGGSGEDFEDEVQATAAARAGAEYIVTRNLAHFSGGLVQALAPAEFLPLVS
jgi:predicted nucleic acid-binding protein